MLQGHAVAIVGTASQPGAVCRYGAKFTATTPREGHAIPPIGRVTNAVVTNRRAVEIGEQILPRAVVVGVVHRGGDCFHN